MDYYRGYLFSLVGSSGGKREYGAGGKKKDMCVCELVRLCCV